MKKKQQRQRKLMGIVNSDGLLSIKILSGRLGVSEMTVRRDLEELRLNATEGESATAAGEYSLLKALQKANSQKERIGKYAASLIRPGDVLAIDTGSTTAKILPHIPSDKNLTVLCYNANVLFELRYRPGIQLMFCGGVYHANTEMFESPESIHFIERIRVNTAFLSAAGVHKELGITCANAHEVPTKSAVIKCSSNRVLVADSEKFGKVRSSYFCDWSVVDAIVTDSDLSRDWRDFIEQKGITLHLV